MNHRILRSITAAFFLVALVSCSSSDGFVDQRTKTCAPGQPVEINVGFDALPSGGREILDDRLTLLVQVANNSNADIVVTHVRADPQGGMGPNTLQVQGGAREFNETIAEAEEHVFEIPMTMRVRELQPNVDPLTGAIDLSVTVALSDGQAYRCRFRVPVR